MKFGYARTSKLEQNLDLQIDELKKAGCEKIITDKISGSVAERPGLAKLKEQLRPKEDVVVVWRLDRLGRSLKHLIDWFIELEKNGIEFQSLHEKIDTSSPTGKLIFHLFGALAEFEKNLIQERTQAGLAAARARGRLGGRPKRLDSAKRSLVVKLYKDKESTVKEICNMMGISKPTLYKYLREQNAM
ncbi:MAG: recombinase family protein [Halobacteriovoraceae bacterium]|nr:recombinase family protein [Halobacteriovoraceae bacterium]